MSPETIAVAFVSALTASVLAYCFTVIRERDRDSEQRRREFIGYLAELDSRIVRMSGNLEQTDLDMLWNGYVNLIHRFHYESAKVADDFGSREKFVTLCKAFGDICYKSAMEDPDGATPRNILRDKLNAIRLFCEPTTSGLNPVGAGAWR